MIPILPALLGCHVFEAVDIPCASDEPCALGDADTDTDSDTDSDTDADTDTDTDTGPHDPTVGWVVSQENGTTGRVVVYGPTAATVSDWSELASAAGPVAYDPATGDAALVVDGELWYLEVSGEKRVATQAFPDVLAVAMRDGEVYVTDGGNAYTWYEATDSVDTAFAAPKTGITAVAPGPDGAVYLTDTDGGAPDLYLWEPGHTPVLEEENFDGSAARARILFMGPDDAPSSCSTAGAVYTVADLAAGNSRPVAFYSGGLTDVSACAYDPGDGAYLLFSPTGGVVRLTADEESVVFDAPNGWTLQRGNFY